MTEVKRRRRTVKPRTTPRVQETEATRAPSKQIDRGTVTVMSNGNLEISCQLAETVPVAQYANVVIGPVGLRWQAQNPGIDRLGVINWDEDDLTPEQQEIYDTVRGWLRATSKLVEHQIAEDREIVEESVRLHNEREAAEEAEQAKTKRPSRRRR
jgi:hypothetical protein